MRPSTAFLSRWSAAHAASRSTATGVGARTSSTVLGLVLEPGEPERGEEPERDRVAVRDRVARRGLERMRERVAEVELRSLAAVVRVAQADRRLERRAAAHLLVRVELPQRLAGEQPRLHDLGEAVPALLVRERLEERRVDDRLGRPVEGADEVLSLGEIDAHLPADRGVDLADERRRHGDPVDASHVRRRDEAGDDRSSSRRRSRRASRSGRARALARAVRPRRRSSQPLRAARRGLRRSRAARRRAHRRRSRSPAPRGATRTGSPPRRGPRRRGRARSRRPLRTAGRRSS